MVTVTLAVGKSAIVTTADRHGILNTKQQLHRLWYCIHRTDGLISKFITPFRKLLRESNCCPWPVTLPYRKCTASHLEKRIFMKTIAACLENFKPHRSATYGQNAGLLSSC
jgi:hypothetical protein